MTHITIKEDVQLPKTEFETLAELRKAIAPRFTEAEIEKMSLKEYITSGAVDEDEVTVFQSGEEYLQYLDKLMLEGKV